MTAAPAEFYDAILANPDCVYVRPVEESPYLPLYRKVADLVAPGESVVELGCGAGQLAAMLLDRGVARYFGLDFSAEMIRHARLAAPGGTFLQADIRDEFPFGTTYVATEVLEHLDDDLGLLLRIPVGSLVILSVPSFDSESHVRYFPERGDARRRYATVLDVIHEAYIEGRGNVFWHVLAGIR